MEKGSADLPLSALVLTSLDTNIQLCTAVVMKAGLVQRSFCETNLHSVFSPEEKIKSMLSRLSVLLGKHRTDAK